VRISRRAVANECARTEMHVGLNDVAAPLGMPVIGQNLGFLAISQGVIITGGLHMKARTCRFHQTEAMANVEGKAAAGQQNWAVVVQNKPLFVEAWVVARAVHHTRSDAREGLLQGLRESVEGLVLRALGHQRTAR
jgi:hypothetical protein